MVIHIIMIFIDFYFQNKEKKNFRDICQNYTLNKYNEICFKKLKPKKLRKNKKNILNRHLKKDINDYKLLKIPFKLNYIQDIKDLHVKKNHCSLKKLLKEYYNLGYTFKGIIKICKEIIKYCPICAQKNHKYYKREPSKQIIFKKPLERIIGDLTELPYEIYDDTEYKYLFNLIDHFSKFCFSFLCKDKAADTILNKVKECFSRNGFPQEFGTDNGTEFKNKKMINYLKSKNIKFIHGKAYNPRSQGCVERLHRTLKTNIFYKKLDDNKNFN